MWASISISKAFIWSTISVTIVGKGELEPQACHSCNVTDPLAGSLGGEREAELVMGLRRKRVVLGLECIMWKWVSILNARDEEREYLNANVKALVLVVLVVEAMMSMVSVTLASLPVWLRFYFVYKVLGNRRCLPFPKESIFFVSKSNCSSENWAS